MSATENKPANVSMTTPDGRMSVEFRWIRDRFVHRVFVDEIEVGHSTDGDGEMDWPPSPPIQQLSLENIGGKPAILGVGAAGRGHWSISVEALDSLENPGLKFDLACRCPGEAGLLASTYRLTGDVTLSALHGAIESLADDATRVVAEAGNGDAPSATHRWAYCLNTGKS
ncbi:hypothetical protein Poly51_12480 [Rubripirellula tenax]|uniref:Uncharacterized protein n=1 Tax=Rubripirellula tenax TaxID=2528015 RepID=A0A5C6FD10_9BACT|nr:hypothetical protein [Rubripirellula tenax]TWU58470.1 hypothetical protein Poly51_12480 [Rubripirellula tenax]